MRIETAAKRVPKPLNKHELRQQAQRKAVTAMVNALKGLKGEKRAATVRKLAAATAKKFDVKPATVVQWLELRANYNRKRPTKAKEPKDSPAVRVASALKSRGLSGEKAKAWLTDALGHYGVPAGRIPGSERAESLEAWLKRVHQKVSSAVAYDLARTKPLTPKERSNIIGGLVEALGKPEFDTHVRILAENGDISREDVVAIASDFYGPLAPSTSRNKAIAHIRLRHHKLLEHRRASQSIGQPDREATPEEKKRAESDFYGRHGMTPSDALHNLTSRKRRG